MGRLVLTQGELKEYLTYDKVSGIFIWNLDRKPMTKKGDIAGCLDLSTGYIRIGIKGQLYASHRLAWQYEYGVVPDEIDHINHCRSDNRIGNLRESNTKTNMKNKSKYKTNTSGVTGVRWCTRDNRWIAKISLEGKHKSLGYFVSFSDAVDARKNAEVLYGFHENHGKELDNEY